MVKSVSFPLFSFTVSVIRGTDFLASFLFTFFESVLLFLILRLSDSWSSSHGSVFQLFSLLCSFDALCRVLLFFLPVLFTLASSLTLTSSVNSSEVSCVVFFTRHNVDCFWIGCSFSGLFLVVRFFTLWNEFQSNPRSHVKLFFLLLAHFP